MRTIRAYAHRGRHRSVSARHRAKPASALWGILAKVTAGLTSSGLFLATQRDAL